MVLQSWREYREDDSRVDPGRDGKESSGGASHGQRV